MTMMNEGLPSKREAHILLQRALSEPLGLIVWASDATAFCKVLYRARQEDPILQSIKLYNTPEGVAIWHEPNDFQIEDEEDE
jgi:hypothetical protein